MNDVEAAAQLDTGITRLLSGEPLNEVVASFDASLAPVLAAFETLQRAVAFEARPEFRTQLRASLTGRRRAAHKQFSSPLARAAALAAASLVIGSAISPALARELVADVHQTLGPGVAQALEGAIETAAPVAENAPGVEHLWGQHRGNHWRHISGRGPVAGDESPAPGYRRPRRHTQLSGTPGPAPDAAGEAPGSNTDSSSATPDQATE